MKQYISNNPDPTIEKIHLHMKGSDPNTNLNKTKQLMKNIKARWRISNKNQPYVNRLENLAKREIYAKKLITKLEEGY